MTLFIYAFEPWGKNTRNISQEVLNGLRRRSNVVKIVVPVEFDCSTLIKTINKTQPDAILGLGQYPRGKKIRIERRARNSQKSKWRPERKILERGEPVAKVSIRLREDDVSRVTYDAGRFVCNYTMYSLLTDPITNYLPLAFIHIPKDFNLNRAIHFVEKKVDDILE